MEGQPDLKSNYGASFTSGRTIYLHNPIGDFLCFGLDATWCDISYTNYKIKHITYLGTESYQYHQGEFSMHIGPSITISPVENLNIHGYFRYAPFISILYAKESYYGNYTNSYVGGASISYGVIGLGIESRSGDCNYKEYIPDGEEMSSSIINNKFKGWKAYLTLRF